MNEKLLKLQFCSSKSVVRREKLKDMILHFLNKTLRVILFSKKKFAHSRDMNNSKYFFESFGLLESFMRRISKWLQTFANVFVSNLLHNIN